MVSVKVFIVNENETNAILIWDETNQGLLIDPGFCSIEEFTSLSTFVKENNISITKIALTHGHFDHVAGVKIAMQKFSCPVYLHKQENENALEGLEICKLKQWELCPDCKMFDYEDLSSIRSLVVGKQTFEILYTPGHTSGSVCLYSLSNKLLLSGDTIFYHNYGRTDFDDGDINQMIKTFSMLTKLPHNTFVIPGHGNTTYIYEEINNNPLVKLLDIENT